MQLTKPDADSECIFEGGGIISKKKVLVVQLCTSCVSSIGLRNQESRGEGNPPFYHPTVRQYSYQEHFLITYHYLFVTSHIM